MRAASTVPGAGDPVQVLYVIINMELGGTERQLFELAAGLDRRRFVPRVCCLRGGGSLAGALLERGVALTLLGGASPGRSGGMRAACTLLAQVRAVAALARRERCAIIHAFLPAACVTAGLASRMARPPVLVTGRRCLGYYKEGRPALRFLENLVNRWTDAVVPNSEAVRADALRRERLDPGLVRVIYNGVAIPSSGPRSGWGEIAGRELGGPVVCLVANFFPYKGHMDFLDAAAQVLRRVPEAWFAIVGDGRLRAEIERRAAAPDLRGRVLLLGSRADSGDVMALSDIVALASHEEGFPNVILEAMARARPVVSTRVGGVPEAVEEGRTGFLVPPRDPQEMASALIRLLEDPVEAGEMGKRGLARVREHFGMGRMVREHEELYLELLARKAARG